MPAKRLYQQVADEITSLIASGHYGVGYRLPPERDLAERFGVSRPIIRQAIISLEVQGKVAVKSNSAAYVLDYMQKLADSPDPLEIIETRVLVEGEAAALAATTIDAEQLQELDSLVEEMASSNTPTRKADRQFHTLISRATQNSTIAAIVQQLWDAQDGLPQFEQADRHLTSGLRISRHKTILNALQSRDPNAARDTMRAHFVPIMEALHKTLEEEALSKIAQQVSTTRERYSLQRFATTDKPDIAEPAD